MSSIDPEHRGRIQAQGSGTEKSVAWALDTAPTGGEMLQFCDDLESQFTGQEAKDRTIPLGQIRRFIKSAEQAGGLAAPVSKSWRTPGSKDIRIDLEVIKGMACVPTP